MGQLIHSELILPGRPGNLGVRRRRMAAWRANKKSLTQRRQSAKGRKAANSKLKTQNSSPAPSHGEGQGAKAKQGARAWLGHGGSDLEVSDTGAVPTIVAI